MAWNVGKLRTTLYNFNVAFYMRFNEYIQSANSDEVYLLNSVTNHVFSVFSL